MINQLNPPADSYQITIPQKLQLDKIKLAHNSWKNQSWTRYNSMKQATTNNRNLKNRKLLNSNKGHRLNINTTHFKLAWSSEKKKYLKDKSVEQKSHNWEYESEEGKHDEVSILREGFLLPIQGTHNFKKAHLQELIPNASILFDDYGPKREDDNLGVLYTQLCNHNSW